MNDLKANEIPVYDGSNPQAKEIMRLVPGANCSAEDDFAAVSSKVAAAHGRSLGPKDVVLLSQDGQAWHANSASGARLHGVTRFVQYQDQVKAPPAKKGARASVKPPSLTVYRAGSIILEHVSSDGKPMASSRQLPTFFVPTAQTMSGAFSTKSLEQQKQGKLFVGGPFSPRQMAAVSSMSFRSSNNPGNHIVVQPGSTKTLQQYINQVTDNGRNKGMVILRLVHSKAKNGARWRSVGNVLLVAAGAWVAYALYSDPCAHFLTAPWFCN